MVINYDGFEVDAYTDAVKSLSEKHYRNVRRYTTSAFMRMKLGEARDARGVDPHIFETRREAVDFANK